MALDPMTAVAITKAAHAILKDAETRQKIVILAIVPFAGFVLLLVLIFYLLTLPFSWLGGMFDLDELTSVEQLRDDERYAAIEEVYYEYMDGYNTYGGMMALPCEGFNITNPYGPWFNPILGKIAKHRGIDLQPTHHAEIMAVYDGAVVNTGSNPGGYGTFVEIRHELNGVVIYSFYAHLSQVDVEVGDEINQGEPIGLEGGGKDDPNPGASTGHHLHFEIRKAQGYGNDVDPYPYLFSR